MADILRQTRDAKLTSAADRINQIARPNKQAMMCEASTLFYIIGGCLATAGLLLLGDGASKLSVRSEHADDQDKDECGFKSSEAIQIVIGILLLVAGTLLGRYGMCIKEM